MFSNFNSNSDFIPQTPLFSVLEIPKIQMTNNLIYNINGKNKLLTKLYSVLNDSSTTLDLYAARVCLFINLTYRFYYYESQHNLKTN